MGLFIAGRCVGGDRRPCCLGLCRMVSRIAVMLSNWLAVLAIILALASAAALVVWGDGLAATLVGMR